MAEYNVVVNVISAYEQEYGLDVPSVNDPRSFVERFKDVKQQIIEVNEHEEMLDGGDNIGHLDDRPNIGSHRSDMNVDGIKMAGVAGRAWISS